MNEHWIVHDFWIQSNPHNLIVIRQAVVAERYGLCHVVLQTKLETGILKIHISLQYVVVYKKYLFTYQSHAASIFFVLASSCLFFYLKL